MVNESGPVPLFGYKVGIREGGGFFYTVDLTELHGKNGLNFDCKIECKIYPQPMDGTVPLYRCFDTIRKRYSYTTDFSKCGGNAQGIEGYIFDRPKTDTVPLYQYYDQLDHVEIYTTEQLKKSAEPDRYTITSVVGYVFPAD